MNDTHDTLRTGGAAHDLLLQQAVARLGREAVAADDPVRLMQRVAGVIGHALGTEFCEVLELIPGGEGLRRSAGTGWADSAGEGPIAAAPGSLVGHVLAAGDPVAVDDFRTQTRFGPHPALLRHGVVSGLAVAVPGRDRPVGVLGAYSRRPRAFAPRDGLFLQGVANVLALFLQRHGTEADGRRNETVHRRVFESPLIGIAFWTREGAISEANDEFLRMIGYTRGDLAAGRVRWVDLTPPEHLHLDHGGLEEIRQTGRTTPYEKEYIRKDGARVPILIGGSGFPGESDRGVCFALDMTRTTRAERELLRLAGRDQALLASSWDVISVLAPDGTMTYQSPSIQRVLGYRENELLGRKVLEHIHPDDAAAAAEYIGQVTAAPGTRPPFELRFRHKDGGWRWCESLGTNLLDHPAVHGLLFNSRDITERKRVENELRQSERRYRTLVTATSMMVWTAAPDGTVIPAEDENPFSGLPRDATAGWGWLNNLHPDDQARAERHWRACLASGEPVASEVRIRRADGAWRRVAVRIVPVRDAGGPIEEWIGVGEDVTELRQAGEELRRRERRYRTLVSALYKIAFVADPRGELIESAGYETVLGPGEAMTSAGWIARIHPDDHGRVVAEWTGALAAGRQLQVEYRVRRYDGTWRRVVGRAIPVPGDERVAEWVGVIEDVTDQRQTADGLRRSEKRYRTLVTASTQIVWVMTAAGEPVVVHGGEGFFGLSDDAIPVGIWLDRTHPDDRDRVAAAVAESLRTGEPLRVEYRLRRADGQWRQVICRGLPVRDEAGRVEEWVGLVDDVSDERQLEEQFRQVQKMEAIGQLAGGVAHDFNNLLTVINGYSEMVLGSLPPADPMRDLLGEVVKAGERAGTLTRQLLLFSRQQVLEPKVLNLNAVVSDAEKMLRRLIGEDVRFATVFAQDLWPVKADPGQVEQVLLNLCVNARDAMPTGGRLTIETRNVVLDEEYARTRTGVTPGDYALLAVSDTGTGMDAATRAHIFEPFFTTKGPGKGTGLGLAVVFGVVKQSGGHIDVYSEVGHGTAFKLYFPRVRDRAPTQTSSPGGRRMPTGTETVLLVEDDRALRALARQILKGCGYTVLEAGDGREAVRVIEGHAGPLDLLISDVVMPHLGGRQLAEQVLALRPGVKVLFLSGYTDDAVVRHGVLHDSVHFLQKPFTPSVLAIKVRGVLDGSD